MRQKLIFSFLLLGILLTATSVSAQNGSWVTIEYPGATHTAARAVNDAGDIVGEYGLNGVTRGFRLASALSISGRVINGLNGVPIAGVTLTISGTNIDPPITTQTNAVGDYSFGNLTVGGTYTVTPLLANHTFMPVSSTFLRI